MSLSDEYRELATLIDALESKGVAVQEAVPVGGDGRDGTASDRFSVRLVVDLPQGAVAREPDTESRNSERSRQHARDTTDGTGGETPTDARSDPDAAGDDAASDSENAADTETAGGETATLETETDDAPAETEADDVPAETEADDAPAETEADDAPAETEADDGISCTHPDCARTFESERGMKIHRTKAHPLSEIIDPDATGAVHQDPEALADVYEQYETFAEMTEALDADVGAQAVRKQMIRHGIHEPEGQAPSERGPGTTDVHTLTTDADRDGDDSDRVTTSTDGDTVNGTTSKNGVDDSAIGDEDTSRRAAGDSDDSDDSDDSGNSDDSDDSADSLDPAENGVDAEATDGEHSDDLDGADGSDAEESVAARLPELDLPGDLTTTELKTAVETANTLYDVQRALDLDSETTRDVLAEYDLLELVSGRAASVRDREELKSEIQERLRRTVA